MRNHLAFSSAYSKLCVFLHVTTRITVTVPLDPEAGTNQRTELLRSQLQPQDSVSYNRQRRLYVHIYCNPICYSEGLETDKMAVNGRTESKTTTHNHNGISFGKKRNVQGGGWIWNYYISELSCGSWNQEDRYCTCCLVCGVWLPCHLYAYVRGVGPQVEKGVEEGRENLTWIAQSTKEEGIAG